MALGSMVRTWGGVQKRRWPSTGLSVHQLVYNWTTNAWRDDRGGQPPAGGFTWSPCSSYDRPRCHACRDTHETIHRVGTARQKLDQPK